jgi:nucleotide-binding universal stress UspA family protein
MSSIERTVIIGVDYSDFCIPAVDEALRLAASSTGARLVPLLALPGSLPAYPSTGTDLTTELVERSKDNLVRLVEARAQTLGLTPPPRIEPCVSFGLPAEQLLAEARKQKAHLVIVGTHSRRGLQHLLLGSVAEEVVRQAPCSVLVARAPLGDAATSDDEVDMAHAGSSLDDVEGEAADTPPTADDIEPQLLTEPHIDAGRVVLHVLDVPTGRVFVCAFEDAETLRIESFEREWVPQPSAAARSRVARAAAEAARRDPAVFGELFEELARQANENR